ncbi:MAG: hypothetical protein B7Z73_02430 [Planctomycetia bacterium 21-64-5]|nr:MAG: hypothetical protein B7Z73_02430 [Planctomycetia bacterium 21-64-5]HQU44489.1 hypothetical protein [Pirellulales bacterium]
MPNADRRSLWYAAFLLLVFLVGCVELEDPDIWWHLRTGQLIFERGAVPRTDWFTYTNPDSPWIDLHWGFQLIAAALWKLGGVPALVVTKSLLAVATFGVAMTAGQTMIRPRQAGKPDPRSAWQTVACWLPPLLIFSGRNQVRPEMFSLLFLAAELTILLHAHARPRLVWLLPVIQLLWINVHGLFVLGLVLWGCFVVGQLIQAGPGAPGRQPPGSSVANGTLTRLWTRLLPISGLMLAATLANPYGSHGALFPITLLARIEGPDHPFYSQFSGEFLGIPEFVSMHGVLPLFRDLTILMLAVLFVLGLLSFVPGIPRRRFDFFRLAVFALFAWLAWKANRNAVLFALVAGTVLQANVAEWLAERPRSSRRFGLGRVLTAAALGVLILGVPFDLLSKTKVRPGESPRLFGVREIPRAFPHEAAEFLGREGMPRYCYALDEGAAAVYLFHNGPRRRVFADARLEVNTRATLDRYLALERLLMHGDPRVFDELTRDVSPDGEGKKEVPALLISLRYLATNPRLQTGLASLKRFRRVYVDYVAVVFLDESEAERLGLAEVRE